MAPHSSTLAWKSHGRRSLVGCSPWGRNESDTTERLHFHFSLSCIGEGNGNPLQCSCLENPRDGGAWWAAVYEIAQTLTRLKRLKRLSSSSSNPHYCCLSYFKLDYCHSLQFKMLLVHPSEDHSYLSRPKVQPHHTPPIKNLPEEKYLLNFSSSTK